MGKKNAITVENVTKVFKVYKDKSTSLKERVIFAKRNKFEKSEVLKGISFEIKKGEAVGLIGVNGCGKSTTLKLLTKIYKPNSGKIIIDGRVSSLIELGAGFHPDMSGRENIYINASIFGIKEKEVDKRIDEIIEFSELEKFIDNPVRTYSSGMYMRLAFSVAINLDADILLIDEILAVGDANFQKKCFNKLRSIKESGTTIVIVSHSLEQINEICDRVIWLENGKVREDGEARLVTKHYNDEMERIREEALKQKIQEKMSRLTALSDEQRKKAIYASDIKQIASLSSGDARRKGIGGVTFSKISITNEDGQETLYFREKDTIKLKFEYTNILGINPHITIDFWILRPDYFFVYGTSTVADREKEIYAGDTGSIELEMKKIHLLPGRYYLNAAIKNLDEYGNDLAENYDFLECLYNIEIIGDGTSESGILSIEHNWKIS